MRLRSEFRWRREEDQWLSLGHDEKGVSRGEGEEAISEDVQEALGEESVIRKREWSTVPNTVDGLNKIIENELIIWIRNTEATGDCVKDSLMETKAWLELVKENRRRGTADCRGKSHQ